MTLKVCQITGGLSHQVKQFPSISQGMTSIGRSVYVVLIEKSEVGSDSKIIRLCFDFNIQRTLFNIQLRYRVNHHIYLCGSCCDHYLLVLGLVWLSKPQLGQVLVSALSISEQSASLQTTPGWEPTVRFMRHLQKCDGKRSLAAVWRWETKRGGEAKETDCKRMIRDYKGGGH